MIDEYKPLTDKIGGAFDAHIHYTVEAKLTIDDYCRVDIVISPDTDVPLGYFAPRFRVICLEWDDITVFWSRGDSHSYELLEEGEAKRVLDMWNIPGRIEFIRKEVEDHEDL